MGDKDIQCIYMTTTIQKWGNSLAVRLPRVVVDDQSLREGSVVSVRSENGRIVMREVTVRPTSVKLSDLLAKISVKNSHAEVSWGSRNGKELW